MAQSNFLPGLPRIVADIIASDSGLPHPRIAWARKKKAAADAILSRSPDWSTDGEKGATEPAELDAVATITLNGASVRLPMRVHGNDDWPNWMIQCPVCSAWCKYLFRDGARLACRRTKCLGGAWRLPKRLRDVQREIEGDNG